MDAAESEQRHEPQDTAGVRRVGCKHELGRLGRAARPSSDHRACAKHEVGSAAPVSQRHPATRPERHGAAGTVCLTTDPNPVLRGAPKARTAAEQRRGHRSAFHERSILPRRLLPNKLLGWKVQGLTPSFSRPPHNGERNAGRHWRQATPRTAGYRGRKAGRLQARVRLPVWTATPSSASERARSTSWAIPPRSRNATPPTVPSATAQRARHASPRTPILFSAESPKRPPSVSSAADTARHPAKDPFCHGACTAINCSA
jgi:hypothetical protein